MSQENPWGERQRLRTVRRILLALSSLLFLLFALYALLAPHALAKSIDYELPTPNALSEFRAIYVGLCSAMALVFAWAARDVDRTRLADVCGIIYVGLACGRITALVVDGVPDPVFIAAGAAELAFGLAILLLRPGREA